MDSLFLGKALVNKLIIIHKLKEESTLEPLTFKINSYLKKFNLPNWIWSELIDSVELDNIDNIKKNINNSNKNIDKDRLKEKHIIKKIYQDNKEYEKLLKDEGVWASKEGFIYEYRPGQYELSKTIRQIFNKDKTTAKVACIEAPTGIGKSVGYLLPAILEARLNKKRTIISTDTKELQIQLINKDIPNVLNSLGLKDKISYGYIKGKNNYICVEKFEHYKNEYEINKPDIENLLSIIILERLIEEGRYGDVEEISNFITNNFKDINIHIRNILCDPNLCRPKKCSKNCLYKNRVDSLKEEDITVVNHSLLAKWPYNDEKPLENIILDEAHNLTEKGYDFFSNTVNYKGIKHFFGEMYPYENINNSIFAYERQSKYKKIKIFDRFYNHVHFDRSIKNKISTSINLILDQIKAILEYGINSDYKNISKYNLRWELNLQSEDIVGSIKKKNALQELKYDKYSEIIKLNCEIIIKNITAILVMIDRNIDEDIIDKEAEIYKFGISRIKELEDIKQTFEIFMEYSEDDDFARIVEIDKNFEDIEFKVVPLKLSQLFEENILSKLESGIFLSATLSIGNNMDYFKRTLGINNIENEQRVIDSIYNYKKRVLVVGVNDLAHYSSKEFTKEVSYLIQKLSNSTDARLLALFNSTNRLQQTYNYLYDNMEEKNINVYMNKREVLNLKNINKKCIALGSKGCFEGVDIPGDGLICVTLDKIPNLNPRDPLYFTIMKKYNIPYHIINYPQMTIKIKQAMGRLLRSKYDYGCFIILNPGSNVNVLKRLETDLHGCRINLVNQNIINKYVDKHIYLCRREVMNEALLDIIKISKYKDMDKENLDEIISKEMKRRYICIREINTEHENIKIKYFNQNYLVPVNNFKI